MINLWRRSRPIISPAMTAVLLISSELAVVTVTASVSVTIGVLLIMHDQRHGGALPVDAIEVDLTSGLTSVLFEVSSALESEEGEFTDMKVLLKHDVPKLGKAGQVKNVADGYARNYLIPQGVAVLATPGAMKQADALAKAEQLRQAQLASDASALAEVLKQTTLTFTARAGEGGKLYGSITSQQIADELKAKAGLEVDKRKIELREPIRSLGTHKVAVHLASELQPEMTVNVVAEEVAGETAA